MSDPEAERFRSHHRARVPALEPRRRVARKGRQGRTERERVREVRERELVPCSTYSPGASGSPFLRFGSLSSLGVAAGSGLKTTAPPLNERTRLECGHVELLVDLRLRGVLPDAVVDIACHSASCCDDNGGAMAVVRREIRELRIRVPRDL